MEQELKFTSGNMQLTGTLRVPDAEITLGTVLLIAGSGQVDRNENHKRLHINAFKEIAEYLAKQRIVTFRYDKRGVGESEGDFWKAGFNDNVADASAALTFLKGNPELGTKPIFILGHSEGALICVRMAAERSDVAGLILLGGPAQNGEEVLRWQAVEIVKGLQGFSKFIIKLLRINVLRSQDKALKKIKKSSKDWFRQGLFNKLNAKWFREFMAYDPAADLPRVRVPVLAVTGSKDIQVDPKDLVRMAKLVKSEFEYHELPDMTHILRTDEGAPSISHYKQQIKKPLDPRLLQLIGAWIQKRT